MSFMEKFIWECAQNHEYIYGHLMFETGMHDNKIMFFCRYMFERMLRDDVVDIVQETLRARIKDPSVADAVTVLQANIVKFRDGIIAKVTRKNKTLKNIPMMVVDLMMEKYIQDGSGFVFMPSLKRRIVTQLCLKK